MKYGKIYLIRKTTYFISRLGKTNVLTPYFYGYKAKKALLVSTIVATSLFSKVSDAVASTLQANDKKDFHTEQITEITDHTASSISMNLDNTPPDTSDVKKLFLTPGFLDANELKEFNTLRNNATKSPIRPYYEEEILRIFGQKVENIEKVILTLAILDPTQQTSLGKRAMEEIDKNEYYQIRIKQIISIMKKKQYIAETEERIKETEERIKETEEKIKELKDFIKELETFEKLFEKKSNQNSIPQSPKMKTSPKSHQKHPNSHQKIAA